MDLATMDIGTLSLRGMTGGYVVAWLILMTGVCVWRTCVAEDYEAGPEDTTAHDPDAEERHDLDDPGRESADRLSVTRDLSEGPGAWLELSRMSLLDALDRRYGDALTDLDERGWPGHPVLDRRRERVSPPTCRDVTRHEP